VFAAAVLAALLFRLALPPALRASTASDYDDFSGPVAERIAAGLGPTLASGVPATQYPPGYPLFLAASFALARVAGVPDAAGALALGIAAFGAVAVLLLGLARRLWSPRVALLAPLVWTTYPLALWLTKQPGSELPFVALLLAGVWLAWRAFDADSGGVFAAVAAGLVLGGAMLVRPIGIGVAPVLAGTLVALRRGRRASAAWLAAALVLANVAAVLPWEAWVLARSGRVVLLSTGGLPSLRDGLAFDAGSKAYRTPVALPAPARAVMDDLAPRVTAATSVAEIAAAVGEACRSRPLGVAALVGAKVARSWYGTDSARHERVLLPLQVVYLALAAWGTAVAWRAGGSTRALAVAVWALVVYFWGMTILVLSIARYMVPAMALLFLLVPGVLAGLTGERARRPSAARG
jgi:4-amino-4-deoxy-L-arabinose transferase-like glycosyltransferase